MPAAFPKREPPRTFASRPAGPPLFRIRTEKWFRSWSTGSRSRGVSTKPSWKSQSPRFPPSSRFFPLTITS